MLTRECKQADTIIAILSNWLPCAQGELTPSVIRNMCLEYNLPPAIAAYVLLVGAQYVTI